MNEVGTFGTDENDVLLAVVRWLVSEGWSIAHYSTAAGQPGGETRRRAVREEIDRLTSVPISYSKFRGLHMGLLDRNEGLDVVAVKGGEAWGIECKAEQKWQGQDTKGDYALANVCWWFGWPLNDHTPPILRTGIAVPDQSRWKAALRDLSPTLRGRLGLWLLWISRQDGSTVTDEPPPSAEHPDVEHSPLRWNRG